MDAESASPAREQRPTAALLVVALFLLIAGLVAWRMTPVEPVGRDAIDRFSADRAMDVLATLLPDGAPHPVDSRENAKVRERIVAALNAAGYRPEIQETTACRPTGSDTYACARVQNVIALLKGKPSGRTVLLSAHYDSVSAGPGVSDDGTGVAILLEAARMLRRHPESRNSVLFLFTDGEEAGLLGAHAFATQSPYAGDVAVAINVEARGTSGQSHLFETGSHSGWLVDAVADSAARPRGNSLLSTLYALLPNDTDLTIFKDRGIQGLNFAYGDRVAHYHTPRDGLQALDRGSLQQQGDNVYDLLKSLAGKEIPSPDAMGERVYTDMLGFGMLHWPASAGPGIALALLGVFVFCHWRLRRRAVATTGVFRGLLIAMVSMLLGALAAYLLHSGLSLLAGDAPAWRSDRTANRWLLWSTVLLAVLTVQCRLQRGSTSLGLWLGVGYAWLLAALVSALLLPGVGYLFALPCMALAAGALVLGFVAAKPADAASGTWLLPALLPATVAFVLTLSTVSIVETMLGFGTPIGPVAMGLLLGMAASFVAPLMLQVSASKTLRHGAFALAAIAISALVLSLHAPPYREGEPEGLNVLYVQGVDGHAWLVSTSHAPPAALARALGPGAAMTPVFPASSDRYLAAPVASAGLPPTRLVVLRTGFRGTARTVTVRVDTGGPIQRVSLLLPKAARLRAIDIAGQMLEYDGDRPGDDGYDTLHCRGDACNGMVLTLVLGNAAPASVLVQTSSGIVAMAHGLTKARNADAVPIQDGDRSIVMARINL